MQDFLTALIVVFASEMGDKSQIVSFSFGTQQRLIIVLPAVFLGILVMLLISAVIGHTAGAFIPFFWMHIIAAFLFFLFAYLSLRGQHEEIHAPIGTKFGAFVAVFLTFVVSELGDKTVFATMALASHSRNFMAVWLGSTLGMFLADVLAIVAANLIGKALPPKVTSIGSAVIFAGAGILAIVEALTRNSAPPL